MEENELSMWVGEFVEESRSKLSTALLVSRLSVEIISQGGSFDDPLFKELLASSREPYERALKTLPINSKEREMLKDAYAYLVSILEDILPYPTEDSIRYEIRVATRIFQFNVLANRLLLGQ